MGIRGDSARIKRSADEHLGAEARVGIQNLHLGLEGVSLDIGLADDAGDFGVELGVGEQVGGDPDRLADAEAGRFGQEIRRASCRERV